MRDEIRDELEPVGRAINDVRIGKGDQDPARQLGEGGFGDVPADPAACGVPAGLPDAALDLDRDHGIRPGEVRAVSLGLTRPQAFLLLKECPVGPDRQGELPLERVVWEGDEPLIGEGLLQMAGHRRQSSEWDGDEPRS